MTTKKNVNVLDTLQERGFVAQTTGETELKKKLAIKGVKFYIGFDPTADSLHVGHFLTMMAVKHLQDAGHKPYILVGGGTGFVGDPSGRTDMRKMMDKKTINYNCECFKKQMKRFIRFEGENNAEMVNNADWLLKIKWIDFLRTIGVHISVNKMISADSFKSRFEKGLSFFEFNYMPMQAYDFLHLFKEMNVEMQLGGNDQWFNILAGADLIRRKEGKDAYGMTLTILTKADGSKMGKTASGAVWLDPNKTSPYEFYQYWINIDDADVEKCLKLLTTVPMDEIKKIANLKGKALIPVKEKLAFEVTKLIHGEPAAKKAKDQSASAFKNQGSDLPTINISIKEDLKGDLSIANLLVVAKLAKSKTDARRLIESNGVIIEGEKITKVTDELSKTLINKKGFMLHKGKKNRIRILIEK